MLLPTLGWGTCHLLPHFHTRHVPRARLADGARAASFTIFFGHDLPRRSCSSFSNLCAFHTYSSVTTCLTANPPLWPCSFFYKRFDTSTAMVVQKPNDLNSTPRSQNINKKCVSHQVLLPALGWGTCRLPPHFHLHQFFRIDSTRLPPWWCKNQTLFIKIEGLKT